jgi:hypothetical protein
MRVFEIGGLGLLLFACQGGSPLGTTCSRASECASPLVCRIGHCRTECVAARDCSAGQVCLVDGDGRGACELPAIDVCSVSCDAPLICASGHCRVECTSATDCPTGHVCTGNACQRADADAAVDPDAGLEDAAPPAHDAAIRHFDAVPDDAGDGGLLCDPVSNTGCGGGTRCGLTGRDPACVASTGSADVGRACTVESDCSAGLSCQGHRCVRICRLGDNAFCGPDLSCSIDSVAGQTNLTSDHGLGFCTEECNLLSGEGCAMGTCALGTNTDGRDFTWCRDIGTTIEGQACTHEFDCAAGLGCHHLFCRRFCDLAGGQCSIAACENVTSFVTQPQVGECNGS